jgi:heme-binding NEAT domain protein
MALPNGAGGYQIGDGNINEAQLIVQGAPTAITATTATLTGAQLANGLITSNTSADTVVTLPTVADLEAAISSAAKVNAAFDFAVAVDDTAYQLTLSTATGWTLLGNMVVLENTGALFRARKTGDGSWTLYRIAG